VFLVHHRKQGLSNRSHRRIVTPAARPVTFSEEVIALVAPAWSQKNSGRRFLTTPPALDRSYHLGRVPDIMNP
jgi:hypothetical protein